MWLSFRNAIKCSIKPCCARLIALRIEIIETRAERPILLNHPVDFSSSQWNESLPSPLECFECISSGTYIQNSHSTARPNKTEHITIQHNTTQHTLSSTQPNPQANRILLLRTPYRFETPPPTLTSTQTSALHRTGNTWTATSQAVSNLPRKHTALFGSMRAARRTK